MTDRIARLFFALLLMLCASFAHSQGVSVVPFPNPHVQFFDANGEPLANGKVFTYTAGTTNLINVYIDATGTVQNSDPIVLDSGGFANIWLANQSYKFVVQDLNGVPQWTADNIPGSNGTLFGPNTWNFTQTFVLPIVIQPTINQIVTGFPGNQTTLSFPAPAGNVVLQFPSTADTVVARATTDTMSNKTLIAPVVTGGATIGGGATIAGGGSWAGQPSVNGVQIVNTPGGYITVPNAASTGTTLNTLTKLTGAPSTAKITATTDSSGAIGITVAGAGTTGSATIQQGGTAPCVFDGATTAGDYVQFSGTVNGNCHDVGAGYPSTGQAVGRVLATNGGAGTYLLILFPAEISTVGALGGSTPSFTGGGGAGTGPTITCDVTFAQVCLDRGGSVKVITGSSPNANQTAISINFGGTYSNAWCTFSPGDSAAAAFTWYTAGSSPTSAPLNIGAVALAASTTYHWTYTCNFR